MTYIVGAILVLLLIALVLVFKPPRQKPVKESLRQETEGGVTASADDQLDIEIEYGTNKNVQADEELELTLDETFGEMETGMPPGESEEASGKTIESPLSGEQPAVAAGEPVEELDLVLEEEEPSATEETGSDEFDEDIPFIEEGEAGIAKKDAFEVAPALADVPEDYGQVEEDETPEELAERLEFFLGTDDEDEPDAVILEEAAEVDEEIPPGQESAVVEEREEAAGVPEELIEVGKDEYGAALKRQEERLRRELNDAVANRETPKLAPLEYALENLCARQNDLAAYFQQYRKLLTAVEEALAEVRQELPGFQLETVRNSLRKGDYEVVQSMLDEAVSQLKDSPELAARLLCRWGMIEEDRGEIPAALDTYMRAFDTDTNNHEALLGAGRLARIGGDTEKAHSLLAQRVNAGLENQEESVELARAEYELARTLVSMDDKEKIEQLLEHARGTMEKLLGEDHPELGPVLHQLAVYHDSAGRYEQAEPLYNKALEVLEKRYGAESVMLGATLAKLAGLYEEIEMGGKSESLYNRALAIKRKVLGENHPDVGSLLGHLANRLKMKKKYAEAEPMFRKSLEIAETALGKDHPNLAVVLNDMAELYSEMGDEKQAEIFQERAFALFGLPGMGDGFVEMDKDTDYDVGKDEDQSVTGS